MKRLINITSVLCAIAAAVSLIIGIRALMGHGIFLGLAFFAMAESGTFFGFIGNILGIAIVCGGFGAMGYYGITADRNPQNRKRAFIFGLIMSGICLLSLICGIFSGHFNIGDFFLLALPLIYTYGILKSA